MAIRFASESNVKFEYRILKVIMNAYYCRAVAWVHTNEDMHSLGARYMISSYMVFDLLNKNLTRTELNAIIIYFFLQIESWS